jgi:hypothetical protein
MAKGSDADKRAGGPNEHRLSVGEMLGLGFLALQVLSIAYHQTVPTRWFCWAPYDIHTRYTVHVEIGGPLLSVREAQLRYRYSSDGWEPRSIHNIFSMISQYESTYGSGDGARVIVDYSINGHPPEQWTWPSR